MLWRRYCDDVIHEVHVNGLNNDSVRLFVHELESGNRRSLV